MTIDITNFNSPRPEGSRNQGPKNEAVAKGEAPSSSAAEQARNSEGQKDSVSLSDTAKAISQIESSLKNAPDVDLDKVEAIRARIESGDYQVNAENMAQKMLDGEV